MMIYTPYDKEVNETLIKICEQLSTEDLQIIVNYINKLERSIYGYTE